MMNSHPSHTSGGAFPPSGLPGAALSAPGLPNGNPSQPILSNTSATFRPDGGKSAAAIVLPSPSKAGEFTPTPTATASFNLKALSFTPSAAAATPSFNPPPVPGPAASKPAAAPIAPSFLNTGAGVFVPSAPAPANRFQVPNFQVNTGDRRSSMLNPSTAPFNATATATPGQKAAPPIPQFPIPGLHSSGVAFQPGKPAPSFSSPNVTSLTQSAVLPGQNLMSAPKPTTSGLNLQQLLSGKGAGTASFISKKTPAFVPTTPVDKKQDFPPPTPPTATSHHSHQLSLSMASTSFTPSQKISQPTSPRNPTKNFNPAKAPLTTPSVDLVESNKIEKTDKVGLPEFRAKMELAQQGASSEEEGEDQTPIAPKEPVVEEEEEEEKPQEEEEAKEEEEKPRTPSPEVPEDPEEIKEIKGKVNELKSEAGTLLLTVELLQKFRNMHKCVERPHMVVEGAMGRATGTEEIQTHSKNFRDKYGAQRRYTAIPRGTQGGGGGGGGGYNRTDMGTGVPQKQPGDSWDKGADYQRTRSSYQPVSEEAKKIREEAKDMKKREIGDKVMAKIKFSLNKLTPDNFDRVSYEVVGIFEEHRDELEKIVSGIISKAQMENKYTQIYTDLCQVLIRRELNITSGNYSETIDTKTLKNSNFRNKLIEKCENIFNQTFVEIAEADRADKAELEKYKSGELTDQDAREDLENRMIVRRKRKFGTVRFIGELVIKNLLIWKISLSVLDELLSEPVESANVELACAFTTQVGSFLSKQYVKRKEEVENRIEKIKKLVDTGLLEKRIILLIKNLMQLHANGWVEEHVSTDQGPMTITNLHASMSQPRAPPPPPKRYEQQQSYSSSQSEYQQGGYKRSGKTREELVKEEQHRKSVVKAADDHSKQINNKFNFFANQIKEKEDGKEEEEEQEDEEQKGGNIPDVMSETGSVADLTEEEADRYQSDEFKNKAMAAFQTYREEGELQELWNVVAQEYRLPRILTSVLNQVYVDSTNQEEREAVPKFLEAAVEKVDPKGAKKIMLQTMNVFMGEYSNVASDAPNLANQMVQLLTAWAEQGLFELELVRPGYDEEFPEMSEPLLDFVVALLERHPAREKFWRNSKMGHVVRELTDKCSDMKEYFDSLLKPLNWVLP